MMSRESCIEKLEQFILDENRIITYKVLSQELKMHVNIAKQYLADFFSIQKSKDISLHVTYFLAGITEVEGQKLMKVLVVSHNNLEKMKELFSEVTSCHIYSISKNKLDECSLLITERHCNKNIGEVNKYSAIKHPAIETKPCILRNISVVKDDTKASMPEKQDPTPSKNGKREHISKEKPLGKKDNSAEPAPSKNEKTEATLKEKPSEKKENSKKPKVDPKSQKSNSLASMWQKKEEKQKDNKTENSKTEAKGKTKSPAGSAKNVVVKNNIMSMFSKQAAKNSANPKKEPVAPSISKKEMEIVTPKEKSKEVHDNTQNTKGNMKTKPNNASTKRKSKSRPSRKSKENSDSESDDALPKKKKHRRICTFDSSDSESENEEAQDKAQRSVLECEDPLESSEIKSSPMLISDEDPIPPTPPLFLPTKGRKKVLKTVQKTYQDDDGFFVTKQEKELVSASDSDEDSKPNKISKDNKPNQFTYRKQSSLTSFFK